MGAATALGFKIVCPHTEDGDIVGICGSSKELGEWHPNRMFILNTTPEFFPLWTSNSSVLVHASTSWKIVIRSSSGAVVWEDVPNRVVPGVGQLAECTVTATFGQPVLEVAGCSVTCDFFNTSFISKGPGEGPAAVAVGETEYLEKQAISEKEDVPKTENPDVHCELAQGEPEAEASIADSDSTKPGSDSQAPLQAVPLLFAQPAIDDMVLQIDEARFTPRILKEIVSHATADKTLAASVVGFAAAGSTCGGIVGFVSGAGVGVAVGVFPAMFTFGLSIPVCASLGAATGTGIAASVGSVVGGAGGWAVCKLGRKLSSKLAATQVMEKPNAEKSVQDTICGA